MLIGKNVFASSSIGGPASSAIEPWVEICRNSNTWFVANRLASGVTRCKAREVIPPFTQPIDPALDDDFNQEDFKEGDFS